MFAFATRRFVGVACLLAGVSCGALSAAEPELDAKKLRPGDVIEVEHRFEWKTGKIIQVNRGGHTARVQVEGEDDPVTVFLSRARLPGGGRTRGKPGQTAAKDDPFATEEEKQDPPRTWRDQTGKFEVEATLVKFADGKVTLKRADGKEITVPLDKLCVEDQAFLKGEKPPVSVPDQLEVTPTNLDDAEIILLDDDVEWTYQPDAAKPLEALPSTRIALGGKDVHERFSGLIFLPEQKKAYVTLTQHGWGGGPSTTRIQECDLASRKLSFSAQFVPGWLPTDISPNGTQVLASCDSSRAADRSKLSLMTLADRAIRPLATWIPYPNRFGRGALPAADLDPAFAAGVEWSCFLDDKHVLTCSDMGKVVLWQIPELKPVYQLDTAMMARVALSGGGKYMALPFGQGIAIVETMTGRQVGSLDGGRGVGGFEIAFRGDGRRLAACWGGAIRVWDLDTRKLVRDFHAGIGGNTGKGSLQWVDKDMVLLPGGTLVDVERQVIAAHYPDMGGVCRPMRGKSWFIGEQGLGFDSVLTLSSRQVPDEEARKLASKLDPEKLMVLKPGVELSIETNNLPDPEAMRQKLTATVEASGFKVVADSRIKLVATLHEPKSETVSYRPLHGFGQMSQHTFTRQSASLDLLVDGRKVWSIAAGTGFAPSIIRLKDGETIDQNLAQQQQLDPLRLAETKLPPNLTVMPEELRGGGWTNAWVHAMRYNAPPVVPR